MKWAIGTMVLVLMLLLVVFLWSSQALAPTASEQKFAKDIYENTEDVTRPEELVEIYDGISVSKEVKVLDLSARGLTGSLKAEIRLLTKVEEIDISHNQFTGLPAEIGQLQNLKVLNLAHNQLTGLPHELGNLPVIEKINIDDNNISEFDMEIISNELNVGVVVDEETLTGEVLEDAIVCSEEQKQNNICTMEYRPVCGLTEVQCVTEPCEPVLQTFGNGCSACAAGNVISYTEGECS